MSLGERVGLRCGRAAFGEAARFIFAPSRRVGGPAQVADEEVDMGGRRESAPEREADLAEIAKALREIVSELREVNTSLRAIARSQAQQSVQKRPKE